MAIGNQSTPGSINGKASQLAKAWLAVAYDSIQFNNQIQALGSSGLQGLTPAGFSAGDATLMLTAAAQLAQLANLYYGLGTLPTALNFDSTWVGLRNP